MRNPASLSALVALVSLLARAPSPVSGAEQCGSLSTCSSGYMCASVNDTQICVPDAQSSHSTKGSKPLIQAPAQSKVANVPKVWRDAYSKARVVVANLTAADKSALGTGLGLIGGPCVGSTAAIKAIPNFPSSGLCLQDSPTGVRFLDGVSAFPAEINVAATFNRDLMRQRAVAMGQEFRGKGIHVALAPMVNLMRAPAGGRNWEGAGGDPYLSGEVAFETVEGIQSQGVQACAKHFIDNEQEHFRDSSSSNVDDRTQHELYLHPFLRSVQANVASVMCSYNQINGTFACEHDAGLNGLLKGELGFQGYVMSDWYATHSTAPSANSGLDMTMPGDRWFASFSSYFGPWLVDAVKAGEVAAERLDDMATRILAGWYLLGQDSGYPPVSFNSWLAPFWSGPDVQGDHKNIIRTIGAASTVLLKNEGNVLPLSAPKSLAVIGSGARSATFGANQCIDHSCNDGILAMGWGSGTAKYPYLVAPVDAIQARAKADGTAVTTSTSDDVNGGARAAAGKNAALVFISADSGEAQYTVQGNQGDRNDLFAWHNGDALVQKVASANNNTIVVVNSVGPILMEAWIDHPNVTAVVWSGLGGQEAGNSLVDVIYGAYNPSGRLPYTIAKREEDYSARVIYKGSGTVQIPYSEGLMVDYRHFDANKIEPRFAFGFGLSYTTFSYADLSISGSTAGGTRQPAGPGSSLDPWLHEPVVTVSFTLTNTGSKAGTEIPQLYTSPPAKTASAPLNLKGFDSIFLNAGETRRVSLSLSRYDLSVWNVVTQRWEVPSGSTGISVGASSRDLRLKGTISN